MNSTQTTTGDDMSTKLATPIRWKIRPPVATLALWAGLMFSPLAMNQARAAMSHTVARLALQSEFTEIRADYWLDIAKAFNLGSIMDRTEAFVEALATLREETFSSYERYMARIELIDDLGETYYDPEIDPADFLSPAAIAASPNPYFP
ncbi:MAG: hypothetical protein KC931_25575, partial [Candidatus Omnitrophica bacterium]|nr:hypothetical protein [Candidatus Omnitrophota bacterium]